MTETLKDKPTVKPDLFSRIAAVVPQLDGWCSVPKAWSLAGAVLALRPACIVEIGVWGGRSLLPMAMAVKEVGSGLVIGIDPWNNEASAVGQNGANLDWWKQCDHEGVYQKYLGWVNKLGVREVVRTIRAKSDDTQPPPSIDILHIDGNHSDQAIKDATRFGPKVRVGGLCFSDDIGWDGGGVEKSIEVLKGLGFQSLYRLDTGMMLQRVRA